MRELQTRPAEDLPEVHVSLVLIRTGAQAIMRAYGRRKGEVFLREWVKLLATEEAVSILLPRRSPSERAAQLRARREAAAWLREMAPVLIASLPPE